VISIQNHDQVGNRARGDRLSTLLTPPAQRLAASLMLLAPHLPLLFMGEEYGEDHPFLFSCSFLDSQLIKNVREGRRQEFAAFAWQGAVPDPQAESTFIASRLTWSWPGGTGRAKQRQLYRDLLHARRRWPALADFQNRAARLLPDDDGGVLRLIRGGKVPATGVTLRIDFNLTNRSLALAQASNFPERLLFTSEAKKYGGERADADLPQEILPYECLVFGPATWEKLL
jgi:maltooligosyltrehalose trehalohydrolase